MLIPVKKIMFGGIGGILPTLSKLATIYATTPDTPLPQPGLYFGIGLYFIIGAVLAIAFADDISDIVNIKDIRQAVFVGIAAPALIANIVAGVSESKMKLSMIEPITSAFAQTEDSTQPTMNNDIKPLRVITVDTFADGAISPDFLDINYILFAIKRNGEEQLVGMFSSKNGRSQVDGTKDGSNRISIGTDIIGMKVYMKNNIATVVLPGEFNTANLEISLIVDNSNDLLWALGAKRKYDIKGIKAEINNIK